MTTNEYTFIDAVQQICRNDTRYDPEAYVFVRESLDFTSQMLKKPSDGPSRHVSGHELLSGIRTYALQEFGPMTLTVLENWGVKTSSDFGEIVFNLVNSGKLGKTDDDSLEDFADSYDFKEAFAEPFLPRNAPSGKKKRTRPRPAGNKPKGPRTRKK